jgi:hypothetical protein
MARVPVVVATAQLHVELDPAGFVDLQHRAMTRVVQRYIAVSRAVAEDLTRRFDVPVGKVTVIPNAVDLRDVDAGDTRNAMAPRQIGQRPLAGASR